MKIKSVYIAGFGKIKNLKLDFENGFNVIYGENENGKSTVMAFIKMMFYGSERGSSQISKNITKKYTAWDNSQMAGTIDFEHEGKLYLIEREFRTSNSTDKVTLCDLDLGTRQTVGADIGLKFFGISCAAFERSVFIGQLGFPENNAEAEGEINSKLSNMVLTGDEGTSFETVFKRLEKAKLALMSKSGKAGEYDKNLKLYNELKAALERSVALNDEYRKKIAESAQKEEEILLLQKNALSLKEKIDAEQDVRNAVKLKKYLELKRELDNLNAQLRLEDGTLIDEMYLRKLQFCISKAEAAMAKAQSKQNEINTLEKSLEIALNPPQNATQDTADSIEKEIKILENEKSGYEKELEILNNEAQLQTSTKKSCKFGIGKKIAVVIVLLGFATCFASIIAGSVIALAGATVFVASVFSGKKRLLAQKSEQENRRLQIERLKSTISLKEQEITAKKSSLKTIETALQSSEAVIEKQKKMLEASRSELEELRKVENEEAVGLLQLFGKYRKAESLQDVTCSIEEISQKASSQKELKQQINFIAKDLGGISYEEAQSKLKDIEDKNITLSDDFDELKMKYEKITHQITELKTVVAANRAEAKASLSSAENPEIIQKRMKELEVKLTAQKEFCDTADIAMQILAQSFAEVRRGYGSVLEKKAGEIFSALTSQKYESVSISKTLDINVTEADVFGNREIDYLSSGTADQAYLSLRMALASLICGEKDTLPILLDDALTQYDDRRMKIALGFLKEYARNGQIILFTCHTAVSDAAQSLQANTIGLS